MKTNIKNFDGYKFRQAKKSILGEAPDFTGEDWELLKQIALDVADKATERMFVHLYYKLAHKLTCK